MGSSSFYVRQKGKSMREAYQSAKEHSQHEDGHDSYSGTIGASRGFKDITDRFKRSGKKLDAFIDSLADEYNKWEPCFGICIKEPKSNSNKIKTAVKHHVSAGTKKWELVYEVRERMGGFLGRDKKKAEAVKIARKHCEKSQSSVVIHMKKKLVNNSSLVATIEYKSSKNETLGEYVFFGDSPD